MRWQVVFTDEARQEFNQLPAREQSAMIHALDKLAAEVDQPFPIRTPVRCKAPIVSASCAYVRDGAPRGRSTGEWEKSSS